MLPERVLISTDAVGGVWRHAIDLARSLNGAGIGCLLAGLGPPPPDRSEAEALAPGTALVWTTMGLDWMQPDADAVAGIGAELAQIGRQGGVDLLHLNLPSQAAGVPDGVPVVAMSHSCIPTWWAAVRGEALPPAYRWQQAATRLGMDRASAVMAPSRSHAEALERVYGPVDGLTVLYNARSDADDSSGGGGRRPVVLAAGRWWDEAKNAAILDRAAARACWPIELAGPLTGPDGMRVDLAHATALGALPPAALRARMQEAAIFASPSLYEPFGLAVLEAAASGAALMLADIPTFRELWSDAALFVPPERPEAWTEAIALLAHDADRRRTFAGAARERAAGFTAVRQLDGLLGIYEAAMQRGMRRPDRIY
ncbi:glycosyltransferase family 4 protein [Lichenicoccus sp.]|uniref:glycosyltransferase family 4 protein n=1 Tax=Lichenicoccus sp. TaxID=2781899 RepID=UPI003D13502E